MGKKKAAKTHGGKTKRRKRSTKKTATKKTSKPKKQTPQPLGAEEVLNTSLRLQQVLQAQVQIRIEGSKKAGWKRCCANTKKGKQCCLDRIKHSSKFHQAIKTIAWNGKCRVHQTEAEKLLYASQLDDEELACWLTEP